MWCADVVEDTMWFPVNYKHEQNITMELSDVVWGMNAVWPCLVLPPHVQYSEEYPPDWDTTINKDEDDHAG